VHLVHRFEKINRLCTAEEGEEERERDCLDAVYSHECFGTDQFAHSTARATSRHFAYEQLVLSLSLSYRLFCTVEPITKPFIRPPSLSLSLSLSFSLSPSRCRNSIGSLSSVFRQWSRLLDRFGQSAVYATLANRKQSIRPCDDLLPTSSRLSLALSVCTARHFVGHAHQNDSYSFAAFFAFVRSSRVRTLTALVHLSPSLNRPSSLLPSLATSLSLSLSLSSEY
jgi:hypothetical protein